MTRKNHYRPGFAMVIAIVLMGLAAMTLTVLGATVYSEARRTQLTAEDAQVRQLLLAGATIATDKAQSTPAEKLNISLPDALTTQSAQLSINFSPSSSPTEKSAQIEASLPRHHDSQQLTLALHQPNWQITQATLHD